MARLLVTTPDILPREIVLSSGCNYLGREGENEILLPHPSVSRRHCELWLTEDAVLVRDLGSRNGTFVEDERIEEAQVFTGQKVRVGDIEMVLAEAPVRISVPDIHVAEQNREPVFMPDGTPCCFRHETAAAKFQCTKCVKAFCAQCVRELRVAGGTPRQFCPECGGACERVAPTVRERKRGSWLDKIKEAFTKPARRP